MTCATSAHMASPPVQKKWQYHHHCITLPAKAFLDCTVLQGLTRTPGKRTSWRGTYTEETVFALCPKWRLPQCTSYPTWDVILTWPNSGANLVGTVLVDVQKTEYTGEQNWLTVFTPISESHSFIYHSATSGPWFHLRQQLSTTQSSASGFLKHKRAPP